MNTGFSNKRILLFGCGYIGTALAQRLVAQGARVSALTRNPETAKHLKTLGLEKVVTAELHHTRWHASLPEPYDAFVNCVSSAGGGLSGYQKSYVDGMRSIVQWTRTQPALALGIYTSSTSVYPQDGGIWVDESADCSNAPATGRLLLQSEQILTAEAARFSPIVLRLAGIYGPGRTYLIDQIKSATDGKIPGRGDYHLNLIHRDDVVGAITNILHHANASVGGIYNLSDGKPSLKAEVVAWLAVALAQPVPSFDPEQVSPRLQRRGGTMPDRKIQSDKLTKTFGWQARFSDFKSGYKEIFQHF